VSMRIRKRIEEPFGWIKTIGGGRKLATSAENATGLVQDHRRRLQPHPHHRPRHPASLTGRGSPEHTNRTAKRNPATRQRPTSDQTSPTPPQARAFPASCKCSDVDEIAGVEVSLGCRLRLRLRGVCRLRSGVLSR
jgi:hypothetical protein